MKESVFTHLQVTFFNNSIYFSSSCIRFRLFTALVEWFSQNVVLGLYVFLVAMPLAAFVIGCTVVLRSWRSDVEFRRATLEIFNTVRAHVASLLIAGVTLMAAGILAIVAMHMITE